MHVCSPGKVLLAAQGDDQVWQYIREGGLTRLTDATVTEPKAFIDEMALTRTRGYAVNRGESGDVHSIAAPVMRFDGKVIAAVAVSFSPNADILGTPRESTTAREVVEAAHRISFSIGYRVDQLV